MSYKREAKAAHSTKLKGYADGGAVPGSMDGGSMLDTMMEELKQTLAKQQGDAGEQALVNEE